MSSRLRSRLHRLNQASPSRSKSHLKTKEPVSLKTRKSTKTSKFQRPFSSRKRILMPSCTQSSRFKPLMRHLPCFYPQSVSESVDFSMISSLNMNFCYREPLVDNFIKSTGQYSESQPIVLYVHADTRDDPHLWSDLGSTSGRSWKSTIDNGKTVPEGRNFIGRTKRYL